MATLLGDHKVIVCAGSGGVGKTTLSAALGVIAARRGMRVLVLTIDPAQRLATALGIARGRGEVKVPRQSYDGCLFAAMVDAENIFENYIREAAPSEAVVQQILDNKLYQQLATTLSGSQEFTSLVKLHECASSGRYDLVILDTPPAEHAIDFLRAPEKLISLFDGTVAGWLTGERLPGGFLGSLMRKGTTAALGTLQFLTGAAFIKELLGFFDGVRSIMGQISETSRLAHELLINRKTAFVLLTSFDDAKIQEGQDFHAELKQSGFHLKAVIVNRAYPNWYLEDPDDVQRALAVGASMELQEWYREMRAYYDERGRLHDRFRSVKGRRVGVFKIPEMQRDLHGLKGLESIADCLCETGEGRI